MSKYNLQNIDEPNLLRDVFPYSEVPKVEFTNSVLMPDMPEDIWITDTTFRDGQQALAPFKNEHMVQLFKYMNQLGGKNGLIKQTELFLYSKKDKQVVEQLINLGYEFPQITSWIRAKKEDFEIVKKFELKETGILTSVSDYHIFLKLKSNREKIMNQYLDVVREVVSHGVVARCHLEDITRADFHGFVLPFVEQLMNISKESGIDVKIRLCDTMGYGIPYPSSKLPRSIPRMINILKEELGVPARLIEWHGHNDFHKVLINASTAWLYGASGANGTLVGLGERTGNPPIEGLIMDYLSMKGTDNTINTQIITEIANFMQKDMGLMITDRYPFIGRNFNVTRAGIHADGVLKNEEIYNVFDTDKLLNRPLKVSITDKSGVAGIAHWINQNLAPKGTIDKRHPAITKIYKWVQNQYDNGRSTSISDDEMRRTTRHFMPELFHNEFEKIEERTQNMVKELVENYSRKPEIRSMDENQINPILEELLESNQYIQMVYVTDSEANQITENIALPWIKNVGKISKKGDNRKERPWYCDLIKDGKTHFTGYYISQTTDKLCYTASTPITNDNGEFIGVLAMDFNFTDLASAVEEDENHGFV